MKIKILGAGVGGLTTAIALKEKGFDVDIYEHHKYRSDIGARQFASSLFHANENECEIRNENSKKTDYSLVVNGMAQGWSSGLPIYATR